MANTTTGAEKGQKDKISTDDIGIFEFIFYGLPEPPELEGVDEDRLRELQNAIQEQLCQRDEERERNITKRVQEFKKTFDFVNSHLLKGVVTMAELTKIDNRQPMGKIKPTDKMVMMQSLFDGTKPATSKQHYERFNLYINFQTKSGHLIDPVREAIDLFEHTLDKTALVWFQTNRSKFKDLTMLKMMFLQRYNPWVKTKREQLQSWNILSFNPKTTDVDEHINLINTLGDMVDQKEEAKKGTFIETMPMMIQTHLIMCKDWAIVKDTAKSLEHIILKCDPPTPAMPMMATGATVPGLYSHIAHSWTKKRVRYPKHSKVLNQNKAEVEENLKKNLRNKDKTHQKPKRQMKLIHTKTLTTIITVPQVRVEAIDLITDLITVTDNLVGSYDETEAKDLSIVNISYRYQRSTSQQNCTQYSNNRKPYFQGNQTNSYRGQGQSSGPQQFRGRGHGRANYQNSNRMYQYYTHDPQPEQYGPPRSLCGGFNHSPKHCYKGENDINNIMEKMSINPHQSQQNNLYQ